MATTATGPEYLGATVVSRVTVIGLALLLMPLLTMLHELGGHAATCLATGGRVLGAGAFYVDCDASGDLARRLVAAAGPGIDAIAALIAFAVSRRLRGDLARLACWYVWINCAFDCAGYFLFSGVAGIGDLSPEGAEGIGPLPAPIVWRIVFALGGGYVYYQLVRLGMRTLTAMIGQGDASKPARRTIAHLYYVTLCVAAILASVPNPVGVFITLASAAAASFGGKAGLISIGYATRSGESLPFAIRPNRAILVLGIVATAAFTLVLGPTVTG